MLSFPGTAPAWLASDVYHYGGIWLIYAMFGLAQLALVFLICVPIEKRYPLTVWDVRNPIGADLTYAVFVRLVLFPLITCIEYPFLHDAVAAVLAQQGWSYGGVSSLLLIGPAGAVLCFLLSFALLDCADYWKHRFSHRFAGWYGLHSVHHAEEKMTFLSDERAHVLEDAITYVWLIVAALVVNVPPSMFPFIILAMRTIATIAHSNTSLEYGPVLSRILISPRFHRAHHAKRPPTRRSINIGTALPWWDICFGTADFSARTVETGDAGASRALAVGGWGEQQIAGWQRMLSLAKSKKRSTRHV